MIEVYNEMTELFHEYFKTWSEGMAVEVLFPADDENPDEWWPAKITRITKAHYINVEGSMEDPKKKGKTTKWSQKDVDPEAIRIPEGSHSNPDPDPNPKPKALDI